MNEAYNWYAKEGEKRRPSQRRRLSVDRRTLRVFHEFMTFNKATIAQVESYALGAGLELMPTGMLDKIAVFFGGEDHTFGDPPFDDLFRVKLANVARGQELLDDRVRRELLLLQSELGPVSLNDWLLTVRLKHVPQHPAIVPKTVRRMIAVAEHLGSRADVAGVGPYR